MHYVRPSFTVSQLSRRNISWSSHYSKSILGYWMVSQLAAAMNDNFEHKKINWFCLFNPSFFSFFIHSNMNMTTQYFFFFFFFFFLGGGCPPPPPSHMPIKVLHMHCTVSMPCWKVTLKCKVPASINSLNCKLKLFVNQWKQWLFFFSNTCFCFEFYL